jgi:L-seryl-tRNA(Ser) seleniumtransferase
VRVCASIAYAGAGSLPDQDLKSFAVAITIPEHTAEALSTALRTNNPPVIGRISREEVMLDMRTMQPDALAQIVDAMRRIARS